MTEQIVKEWIKRAEHDLEVAKLLISEEDYFDVLLFHIHQAVEKYLKGFLIYNGWKLKKIHDIELLITEAMGYDDTFQNYLDLGRELTAFYYEERYPPGPISFYSKEEIEETLKVTEELIDKLKLGLRHK